jgi:hypothetical protein
LRKLKRWGSTDFDVNSLPPGKTGEKKEMLKSGKKHFMYSRR